MSDKTPTAEELKNLVGEYLYDIWTHLTEFIDERYDTEHLWNSGGKKWNYEYKYRRGGKTLCSLYAKEKCIGFMVIFGKDERLKFEADKTDYSKKTQAVYDEAQTYHDGKWLMFSPKDTTKFHDYLKLLAIKRKPDRKN